MTRRWTSRFGLGLALLGLVIAPSRPADALGTAFTFQGQLLQDGVPHDGFCDFQFKLYTAVTAGAQHGTTQTATNVAVEHGLFSVPIDFGNGVFDGRNLWLDVGVRCPTAPSGAFMPLDPRQEMTGTPYALFSQDVNSVGSTQIQDESILTDDLAPASVTNDKVANGISYSKLAGAPTSLPPSGSAGGDLTGSYPNPTIGSGAVGFIELASNADSLSKVSDGTLYADPGQVVGIGYGSPGFGFAPIMVVRMNGARVDIGNNDDGARMRVIGGGGGLAAPTILAQNADANGIGIWSKTNSADSNLVLTNEGTGDLIRGFTGPGGSDFAFRVQNDGRTRVSVLEITGGADLAEPFEVAPPRPDLDAAIEPGMVVVINADAPGRLELATTAYDQRVAGVISGGRDLEPGMVMAARGRTEADGDRPVALTGRVWAHCDATYGAIVPGDLLTTSDTPGHAMKVGDHERARGAIIGKAMSALDAGRGEVLILVSLQ